MFVYIDQSASRLEKSGIAYISQADLEKKCWVQPLALGWNGKSLDIEEDSNVDLNKQGICAFYDGLIENAHISKGSSDIGRHFRQSLSCGDGCPSGLWWKQSHRKLMKLSGEMKTQI
ncbi:hypothetical protein CEXT_225931, partial [Caerostris extrusa]